MNDKTKVLAGIAGTGLMLAGMGVGAATAFASGVEGDAALLESVEVVGGQNSVREVPNVQGEFSFSQEQVTPVGEIAKNLGTVSRHLCGASLQEETDVAAEDWTISVVGEVEHPYEMTVAELQEDPAVQSVLMGCSCAANPVDGRASVNAEVTGVAVKTLIGKASVRESANTITFISSDGYEVALPLQYVTQRYCPIVFDVNGSPIAESVGGTNQLWLGSTSAKYFARNIVSIQLETRDVPPDAPGSEEAEKEQANLPNVGIYFGGEVQ